MAADLEQLLAPADLVRFLTGSGDRSTPAADLFQAGRTGSDTKKHPRRQFLQFAGALR